MTQRPLLRTVVIDDCIDMICRVALTLLFQGSNCSTAPTRTKCSCKVSAFLPITALDLDRSRVLEMQVIHGGQSKRCSSFWNSTQLCSGESTVCQSLACSRLESIKIKPLSINRRAWG